MNNERRTAITYLISEALIISGMIDELKEDIQAVLDQEQDAFDAMPESLQGSERGQASGLSIDQLQEAIDTLDGIDLDDVALALGEAKA